MSNDKDYAVALEEMGGKPLKLKQKGRIVKQKSCTHF
jgi:hypothetical protein